MSNTLKSLLFLLIGIVASSSAYSQSTTSTISGRVADTNGVLQGAMITAVYTPSGIMYHAFTQHDGSYRINDVVAGGPYTIKAEASGHRTLVYKDVMLLFRRPLWLIFFSKKRL